VKNLITTGRQGQFNHNNLDHSMLRGIRSAEMKAVNIDNAGQWYSNLDQLTHFRIVEYVKVTREAHHSAPPRCPLQALLREPVPVRQDGPAVHEPADATDPSPCPCKMADRDLLG